MVDFKTIPERWVAAWSQPDPALFAKLFSPKAVYTDHSFQVVTTNIQGHHKIWRTANPDFRATLDPFTPIWWASDSDEERANCSFRTINTGTFTGELPGAKASGESWQFSAMLHITIEDGLIVQLDEFYRDTFDDGVPPEKFQRLTYGEDTP